MKRRLIPRRWWGPRRRGDAEAEVRARAAAEQAPPPARVGPICGADGRPLPTFEGLDYSAPCGRCGASAREHGPSWECPA